LESVKWGIEPLMNFKFASQRLSAAGDALNGITNGVGSLLDRHDFNFISEAIERERHDGYMPRHSVYVLPINNGWLKLLTIL
jgi:RNA polymerase I-specific transcription initiation factor RRN6